FDRVDPLLGGDQALRSLTEACRARGLKCLGDLTLNHCGSSHVWFRAAQIDRSAPETKMFAFTKHPDRYATFSGVKTLPKLNYSADITRWRMYLAPHSALRRW